MNSIVVEQHDETVDGNEEVIQTVEEELAAATPAPETEDLVYEIPDKFKDKSIEDVVKSYTELEKEFGRKNNEVGELRKLADQYIEQQLSKEEPKETKKVDFDSLVDDPDRTISEAVANNPALKEIQANLEKQQRAVAQKEFEGKHPDYMDVVQAEGFVNFVRGNPVLTEMYQRAQTYDYQAADGLLTMYKQLTNVQKEQATEAKQAKKEQVMKDAAVEKGSSGAVSKKTYSRTKLIKMRNEDPDQWSRRAEEFRIAYAEGRVKQ